MLKAFFRDGIIYAIPALISRSLGLILFPLYTRVLSPADYGSLDLLAVFAGIVNLTVALEVSQGVARFYGAEPDADRKTRYVSSAFWFTVVCYSIFAIAAFAGTKQLSDFVMGQKNMEASFRLGIISIWVNGVFYIVQNQFRWELRSREFAIVSTLMSISTVAGAFAFGYLMRGGLEGLILGNTIGFLIGIIAGLSKLRHSFRFVFDFQILKEMLAFSTPLVFSSIAVWVNVYISRILISYFLSVDDVGLYGIGFKVASISGLIVIGFQAQLTPLVYTYHNEAETPRNLSHIFRYFLVLAFLSLASLSLFAKDLVRLLTTEPFYGGAVVVCYLVPPVLLSKMYIFAPGISIAKKTNLFIWINVGAAFLSIGLNCLLIPSFGIVGAGIATLVAQFLVFLAHMVLSQRFYPVPHDWRSIFYTAALAFSISWFIPQLRLNDYSRWSVSVVAIVVLLICFCRFRLVRDEELRGILSPLKKIGSRPVAR